MINPHVKILAVGEASAVVLKTFKTVSLVGVIASDLNVGIAGGDGSGEMPRDIPRYDSIAEAIRKSGAEAAFVYVPNTAKNPIELECSLLVAGMPVICPKLRLNSWADAEKLVRAARRGGTSYYAGEQYRYCHEVEGLKLALPKIGELSIVRWKCIIPDTWSPWMQSYTHLGLEDLALHHFGVLHYLVGCDFDSVAAISQDPRPPGSGPFTITTLSAIAKKEWHFSYHQQWGCAAAGTSWLGEVDFVGKNGLLTLRDSKIEFLSLDGKREEITELPHPISLSFLDHILGFLKGTLGACGHPLTLDKFLPVCGLIRQAKEQNRYPRVNITH